MYSASMQIGICRSKASRGEAETFAANGSIASWLGAVEADRKKSLRSRLFTMARICKSGGTK